MSKCRFGFVLALTGAFCIASFAAPRRKAPQQLSKIELRNKIEGGWAGQMIGVSFGAPTEFHFNGQLIPRNQLPVWRPEMVANSLKQDDLYVDMAFAKVLDEKGLNATTADFGEMLRDAKFPLWHANLAARRGLRRGIPASKTGTPQYNGHANDIDFQIEADFIGLMAPGLPNSGNDLCLRAGRVVNTGDGIIGGMFVSGMYSSAFFETDPEKVVQAGLRSIPADSSYAHVIRDVLMWHRQNPADWRKAWSLLNAKWDKNDPCPEGALRPLNIDAKLNGGYVALGLLYGQRDFGTTIRIATSAGQDSDCNPSTAGGVLGVMLGYRAIPDEWKSGIAAIANQKFSYTDFTFRNIVDHTERRALALIQATGGRVEGDVVTVKTEDARRPAVPLWTSYGTAEERIKISDPRWHWSKTWTDEDKEKRGEHRVLKLSSAQNAEAAITFKGTGAIISGTYLPNGGTATVYLDGKMARRVDVCSDESSVRTGESIWHVFGLKNQDHALRLVVDGKPGPNSNRNEIAIEDLVVFR